MEMLPTYMTDVSSKTPNRPPFVLLGLKADLEEYVHACLHSRTDTAGTTADTCRVRASSLGRQRQVTQAMAEAFAAQHGMVILQHAPSSTAPPRSLLEVSCKTFKNLDMVCEWYDIARTGPGWLTFPPSSSSPSSGCCCCCSSSSLVFPSSAALAPGALAGLW